MPEWPDEFPDGYVCSILNHEWRGEGKTRVCIRCGASPEPYVEDSWENEGGK